MQLTSLQLSESSSKLLYSQQRQEARRVAACSSHYLNNNRRRCAYDSTLFEPPPSGQTTKVGLHKVNFKKRKLLSLFPRKQCVLNRSHARRLHLQLQVP